MKSKVINLLNNVITHLIYTIYPIVLVLLLSYKDPLFLKVLLVPLISFILVSLYRNHINAPRPYEVNDTEPIISKHSKGRSFPSRHVFSAFVIATTLFFVSKVLGIFLIIAGVGLAILRVIGGVHFKRDVIAGALIGILSGIIGFYL